MRIGLLVRCFCFCLFVGTIINCVVSILTTSFFLLSFHVCRAAVCKNPNDYQKDKNIPMGSGNTVTCDYYASSSQYPLTSETKDCSNIPYDAQNPSYTPKYVTNVLSMSYGCCGAGLGACALNYSYGVFVFCYLWEPLLIAWYPF